MVLTEMKSTLAGPQSARACRETIEILTYPVGEPDPNPMFQEKRVYQGSSGTVYPYPVVESVVDTCEPRPYDAMFLENDYLKVMILPDLGGRVQMALDKTNDYHFVDYNRVIKPALVGLAVPWINGGIEFNWPQHLRPSTCHPVDVEMRKNAGGSATVWCCEIDSMVGTKGMHAFALQQGRAYLRIDVRLFNRTRVPEAFLWWANLAVHVDEHPQSIFPPDVTAIMDHGKRGVRSFPIATGEYYKVDNAPGTDISRYRNIPVPTSYMAYRSDYDFVGAYDYGRQAGLLHVASRQVSPSKKQWTWGCGDFGQAWDRHLTNEDGPYVELMCGVITDNQPDFSWLAPGEERAFTQHFMPYKGVGVIKNATIDAAVGLEAADGIATVRAYTTALRPGARVTLAAQGSTLLEAEFDGDPRTSYYREALRRDAGDLRCKVALGRLLFRRGLYVEAEQHYRAAVERATRHNPKPIDGEAFYGLGLSLIAQREFNSAEAALHKAAWNAAWQDAAWYQLARLAIGDARWGEAEALLRRCLDRNGGHHHAVHLLLCTLLQRGAVDKANQLVEAESARDPFNVGVLFERAYAADWQWDVFQQRMSGNMHNDLELANDYAAAGRDERAAAVLLCYLERHAAESDDPLLLIHLAAVQRRSGDSVGADATLAAAAGAARRGFFPNTLSDLAVLEAAVAACPDDARARCDLGNLLYSKRRYDDAICHWKRAAEADPTLAQPRRNLGLAYFNKRRDLEAAWQSLSEAFRLNPRDAPVLFGLDQLAKRLNHDPLQRLERLQGHESCVAACDDLTIELIALLNQLGRHEDALDALLARHFHPWEGGEGKASAQYVLSLTESARQALADGRWDDADALFRRAFDWPHSLGEGKLAGIHVNNVHYLLGLAARGAGREDDAQRWLQLARDGLSEPASAQYYCDQPPETIFYQGLAWRAMGDEVQACKRFEKLILYADAHQDDECHIDFFAVSLPDFLVFDADLNLKHQLRFRFMRSLGQIGLHQFDKAVAELERILALDVNHMRALMHLRLCDSAARAAS